MLVRPAGEAALEAALAEEAALEAALAPGQEVRDVVHTMAPRHKPKYLRSLFMMCEEVVRIVLKKLC